MGVYDGEVMKRVIGATGGQRAVFVEEMGWPDVAALHAEGERMVMLPVGATEQHGPHLPVNTDTVIAQAVCWYASAKSRVPVLPAMPYSVSLGHTRKWPGTFSLKHRSFMDSVSEVVDWCAGTGWERLVLVNSHFGNDASLRAVVEAVRLEHLGRLRVALVNTFRVSDAVWDYFVSDAADLHANKAETDLMLYLAPSTVRMELVEDDPDRTVGKVLSYPVSETSRNGVTGKPSEGTEARGETLFREMGDALVGVLEIGRSEEVPLGA